MREATTEAWLWRRLVRVPPAPEKVAGVTDLTRTGRSCLEPERLDLGWREPHTRDRVDPSRGECPPRPLDVRGRDVRLSEKRREPVESLDRDMPTTKPTTQRRERDAVLGIDGIDGGFNPDNVQEPGDLADHRCRW